MTRYNTACTENLLQGTLSSCTSRLEEKMFWMTLCGLVVSSDHPYHLANSKDGYTAEYCTDGKRLAEVKVFFLYYIMQMTCKVTWDSGRLSTESLNSALPPPPLSLSLSQYAVKHAHAHTHRHTRTDTQTHTHTHTHNTRICTIAAAPRAVTVFCLFLCLVLCCSYYAHHSSVH